MALTITLAEEQTTVPEGATVIEFESVGEAVNFTETTETGWNDPAQIQQTSNPELFNG